LPPLLTIHYQHYSITCTCTTVVNIRIAQSVPSRSTVPHGSACVEPYTQATVLTKLHTMKNGPEACTEKHQHEKATNRQLSITQSIKDKFDKLQFTAQNVL